MRRPPRWRELERSQILTLRMVRRLLSPVAPLRQPLAEHPRWGEFEAWQRVVADLP
ncbi:hypothetical protein GCM10010521_62220 [Streptomyces rameus]|uniref:Uncharacterized protein n=1 Tax=Streptomyces rameus TaxID=68261 RepID=A0ABP6HKY8_9ACTN